MNSYKIHILLLLLVNVCSYVAHCNGSDTLSQTVSKTNSTETRIEDYRARAKEFRLQFQLIQADQLLDTAMVLSINAKNLKCLATVYLDKAIVKKQLNDQGPALEYYIGAMRLFEAEKDYKNLTITYLEMAEFYRKVMKFTDAVESIIKAKYTYNQFNFKDTVLLAKIYNRSAAINAEYNPNPRISMKDSRKAIELARAIGDSVLMAVSYNEIGFSYKNLRQFDSAEYFYKEAERLWMANAKYAEALHAMNNRAQLYTHYNNGKGIPLYKRIITLSDSLKVNYSLLPVYWALYYDRIQVGDTLAAFRYFFNYHNEADKVFNAQTANEFHNINSRFKNEKILSEYQEVSKELEESSKNLELKRKEQSYLITFLIVLIISLSIIVFLVFKLKKSNKDLGKKNSEKDTLIQEIHHRVKNNLQFISSLMNMQMKASGSPQDDKTLNDTSRRINAMALVHEMLYNRSDNSGIAIKLYIEELVESLNDLVSTEEDKITFEISVVDFDFKVADAISLGMISSELISNSLKHAFHNSKEPKVKISLLKTGIDTYTFIYADNGTGFILDQKDKKTLGLRLVDIFSRQLKGDYSINGDKGFEYTLQFNLKQ